MKVWETAVTGGLAGSKWKCCIYFFNVLFEKKNMVASVIC